MCVAGSRWCGIGFGINGEKKSPVKLNQVKSSQVKSSNLIFIAHDTSFFSSILTFPFQPYPWPIPSYPPPVLFLLFSSSSYHLPFILLLLSSSSSSSTPTKTKSQILVRFFTSFLSVCVTEPLSSSSSSSSSSYSYSYSSSPSFYSSSFPSFPFPSLCPSFLLLLFFVHTYHVFFTLVFLCW